MNRFTFVKLGRTLCLVAVVAVGVACWLGCGGGGDDSSGDDSGVNNNSSNNNSDNSNGGGDGSYDFVEIGGLKWMKKNLDIATDSSIDFGGDVFYDWSDANTVCPAGWKLPDTADWRKLIAAAGGRDKAGTKLKAKTGWPDGFNGVDTYGFSALPSFESEYTLYDVSDPMNPTFKTIKSVNAAWWSSTKSSDSSVYAYLLHWDDSPGSFDYDYNSVYEVDENIYIFGTFAQKLSVRCVKK